MFYWNIQYSWFHNQCFIRISRVFSMCCQSLASAPTPPPPPAIPPSTCRLSLCALLGENRGRENVGKVARKNGKGVGKGLGNGKGRIWQYEEEEGAGIYSLRLREWRGGRRENKAGVGGVAGWRGTQFTGLKLQTDKLLTEIFTLSAHGFQGVGSWGTLERGSNENYLKGAGGGHY